jgi:hypothetical protein
VVINIGLIFAAAVQAIPAAALVQQPAELPKATLEGRAILPADTFAPGPPSGSGLGEDEPKGGREPPFESQPVGGFSAVLDAGGGEYLAMTDNGFGSKGNSSDFLRCASTAFAPTSRPLVGVAGRYRLRRSYNCATLIGGTSSSPDIQKNPVNAPQPP